MCDVFDAEVPKQWRDDLWQLIHECADLDWLLLTKRPENIDRMLPSTWDYTGPWPQVWLGTTVAAESEMGRIGTLSMLPAAVRFVSFEPLVDLPPVLAMPAWGAIDWAIVGGESGPGARAMDPDWARYIRDACRQTEAAFLMKQMGGNPDARKRLDQMPEDLRIREYPSAT
jgi:protein gp37